MAILQVMVWVKELCEYIGGATDSPPNGFPIEPRALIWGVWWGLLLSLVVIFGGQGSKFIYIDF
jgi:hypothetical protein